jgi:hypothetical protein
MGIESIVINASVTVLSLGLLIVSLISYKKHNSPKLIFISLVFLIFLIKGILFSLGLFYEQLTTINSNQYLGLFDLIILVALFIATLKS